MLDIVRDDGEGKFAIVMITHKIALVGERPEPPENQSLLSLAR